MHKLFLIIRREYLVRVRTKAFLMFTVLTPLLLGSALVLPTKLMMNSSGTKQIIIVAADAELANAVKSELAASHVAEEDEGSGKRSRRQAARPEFDVSVETKPTEALRQQLTAQIRDGNLDGFAWIEADADTTRKGTYYSRHASDFIESSLVSRALRIALSQRQLAKHGFSAAEAKSLLSPVDLDTVHIDKQGANKSNGMGAFFLPFLLLLSIYMTVLIYGVYVMRSVIEEKSSRVIEVLLGSVTPMQLMAGKIIGVGAVGLTQIGVWIVGGTILGNGAFAMAGDFMKDAHVSTATLILLPVFFILGYATYSCVYAAIGAMVNSDEEAQQLQFPITMPLAFCMIIAMSIIQNPSTPIAFWLSMFPLTAPIIMFVRVSVSDPPVWQVALSISLSLASLYGMVWLTSRIYRVGILMYGKRPTLPEILKWIRYA